MLLNGRVKLVSPYTELNRDNILKVFNLFLPLIVNSIGECDYLFRYYRGIQPILHRKKKIREDICNKIVENHANEITNFKTGYLLNKPIQYTARKEKTNDISLEKLNDYMCIEDKEGKDKQLANYQSICGTAFRLVLPNSNFVDDGNSSPFLIYNFDPREAFVIYSTKLGHKPIFGGFIYPERRNDGTLIWNMEGYTETAFIKIVNQEIVVYEPHTIGYIPIIEYPLNEERIGDFEKVITLLDAINNVQSNRIDGVEQFIQALMVFKNVDIDEKDFEELKDLGAIKIKDNGSGDKKVEANVNYLTQELNQTQVQTLKDDMYRIVQVICGIPNRNGGSSTSDTGVAVIMRDGWSDAEARANDTEQMFKTSEKKFLRIALSIAKTITNNALSLSIAEIDIRFTRRNYENLYQKAQVLDLLLKNNKVAPRLAFSICGLFSDSNEAYEESKAYYDEIIKQGSNVKVDKVENVVRNKINI